MKSRITTFLALMTMSATILAQPTHFPDPSEILAMELTGQFGPPQVLVHQLAGPPGSYVESFVMFPGAPTVFPFRGGFVGPTGTDIVPVLLPQGVTIPEIWLANLVIPPAGPPHVSLQAATVAILPPPAPVCPSKCGAMSYDPDTGTARLRGRICPGSVVHIRVNGASVGVAVADANGDVFLEVAGLTPPAGAAIDSTCDGAVWLGAITAP